MNVDEMLDEITWEQFQEWVVFAGLSPFSAEREDIRFASIVHALANINRDSKKKPTPYKLQDFVLRFGDTPGPPKEAQTPEQQKAIGRQFFEMFGGGNGPRRNSGNNPTDRRLDTSNEHGGVQHAPVWAVSAPVGNESVPIRRGHDRGHNGTSG